MEADASNSLPTPPTTSLPDTPVASQPPSSQPPPDITPSSSQTTQQGDAPIAPSPLTSSAPVPSDAPPQQLQHDLTIDAVLHRIATLSAVGEYEQLAGTLRELLAREAIFVQSTSSGEDPLRSLDPTTHTLGMLYILAARLFTPPHVAPTPPLAFICEFCKRFDPQQARFAPERVTQLARGIVQIAEVQNIKAAIAPLYDLLTRYAPDLTYLTTIHQHFLTACVSSHHYTPALRIISTPISSISLALSPDLTYNDHLIYHYTAGVAAAALRKWELAADLFETCASAPVGRGPSSSGQPLSAGPMPMMGSGMGMSMGSGMAMGMMRQGGRAGGEPAMLQADAMKKLVLVQLITHGAPRAPPKYTHNAVARVAGQGSAYGALARAYPGSPAALAQVVEKDGATFAADGNMGLVKLALARAPRWTIKRLTETYLTLGLAEIGRQAGVDDAEEVRRIVLDMIDAGDINATISADGTVAFADDAPVRVSKAQMDAVLARAQAQERHLRALEREIARSKEYLGKAVRSRDEGAGGGWLGGDDGEWGGGAAWSEDAFANL